MTAAITIIRGPSGSGKTSKLIESYRRGIASAIWIAPNERAGRIVASQGDSPSQVLTFPELARSLVLDNDPDWQFVPELHQRVLLENVIAPMRAAGRLKYFAAAADAPGFPHAVFELITELQSRGISPGDFSRAADRSLKDRDIAAIYSAFTEYFHLHRLLDRASSYARAADHVRSGHLGRFRRVSSIFVDGFVDFTPPQWNLLFAWIEIAKRAWIALPCDDADVSDRAELFRRPIDAGARLKARFPHAEIEELACASADFRGARPAGLQHLRKNLFRINGGVAETADGVDFIEAPGAMGELRMAARAIKTRLLAEGNPAQFVVTARTLTEFDDLIDEVFAEYGIPFEMDRTVTHAQQPAVATLLRAWRLKTDEFPFAATTALLRNTLLQPEWADGLADDLIALEAEVVLRSLSIPRGRDAILRSLHNWAQAPEPPLEDDEAEAPRRVHLHRLAVKCEPFLIRFFQAWDRIPGKAALPMHLQALREFATDLGVHRQSADAAALTAFFAQIEAFIKLDARIHGDTHIWLADEFEQLIARLAQAPIEPVGSSGPRVVVVPVDVARTLECDHLILLGLGENSFPKLSTSDAIYSDSERERLRLAGLDIRTGSERLVEEQLLFLQLIEKPRDRLTLSYAAHDSDGSSLLPSSFLLAVQESFAAGAPPVERRRMLIEGLNTDRPLSPAEYRVRWALLHGGRPDRTGDLFDQLRRAEAMTRARFHEPTFNQFDGRLADAAVREEIANRFGPKAVFSASGLETYAACPFKFFVGRVLGLSALSDPSETFDASDKGRVVHRALARLHRRQQRSGSCRSKLVEELMAEMNAAIEEIADRSGSTELRTLWQMEAKWLQRLAIRFGQQWAKFLQRMEKEGRAPRPHAFELAFGMVSDSGESQPALVIEHGGRPTRIAGRIDRVDLEDLRDGTTGFWIIDYKTGASRGYSAADVDELRRVQLPLYAMMVEQHWPQTRPVGLAYWHLRDTGVQVVLPARGSESWRDDSAPWEAVRSRLTEHVAVSAESIRAGEFPLHPQSENCTATCDFGQMCRIGQSRSTNKSWSLPVVPAHSV